MEVSLLDHQRKIRYTINVKLIYTAFVQEVKQSDPFYPSLFPFITTIKSGYSFTI